MNTIYIIGTENRSLYLLDLAYYDRVHAFTTDLSKAFITDKREEAECFSKEFSTELIKLKVMEYNTL